MLYVTYMVSEEKKAKGVSRRKFLAATGAGVAGIVVGGVVGSQLFPKVETTTATETATKTTTATTTATTTTTSLIAKYPCPFCDKEFSSEAELGEHIKTAHAELITKEVKPPTIKLIVNGSQYEFKIGDEIEPNETLAETLRERLGLTGTKIGCDTGECGSCTVIMDGKPVLSCLVLTIECDGKDILTVEGLAKDGRLHPIQEAFIEHHGLQCGFCTPGILMTTKALLDRNRHPTREEVREALSGNICKCGAYKKIIESVLAASEKMR